MGGVLSPELVVATTLIHCILQGILVPLLVSFLNSGRDQNKWFRAYVVFINLASLTETIIHIVPIYDTLHNIPPRISLILGPQILTNVISASVQAFFISRCWRIFQRRLLPVLPFLALHLTSIISGTIIIVYLAQGATPNSAHQRHITFAIWVISLFLLDLSTTTTTTVYLYRSYAGFSEYDHRGIYNTVWQVIWTSAAPPLVITSIPLINQFVSPSLVDPLTIFPIALTGKFFLLSLMISLVGRGYIREKFDQLAGGTNHQDATLEHSEQTTPAFSTGNPVVYELEAIRRSTSRPPLETSTLDASQLQPKKDRPSSFTETSSGYSSPKVDV
ncbi:hypothetical protein FRC12_016375 [Ceratobasidium sp. 428]|nr:hypothetical protein FRC09_012636 [Ceratobasidium sp. 395]KAG8739292.1 hypothetical protein FRC12_016375 [Ceratobasidium sp. 428]